MQGVANVSFLGMFIMYLLAALFGYLTFNGEFFFLSMSFLKVLEHIICVMGWGGGRERAGELMLGTTQNK